jgi:hypothetical protein
MAATARNPAARQERVMAMRRIAIGLQIAALGTLLSGCKDVIEKRRAAFMERCAAAKFEPAQCAFLLNIVEQASSDTAAAEATAGAMAASIAAIHAGTR